MNAIFRFIYFIYYFYLFILFTISFFGLLNINIFREYLHTYKAIRGTFNKFPDFFLYWHLKLS